VRADAQSGPPTRHCDGRALVTAYDIGEGLADPGLTPLEIAALPNLVRTDEERRALEKLLAVIG